LGHERTNSDTGPPATALSAQRWSPAVRICPPRRPIGHRCGPSGPGGGASPPPDERRCDAAAHRWAAAAGPPGLGECPGRADRRRTSRL